MKQVIFAGLDVDDNTFHGCAFFKDSGEVIEFKTRPHVDGLSKKLKEISGKFPNYELRCCYEATYIGFSLARDLAQHGLVCDVIAPGSIPRVHGNQVKTDRIDAAKLAQFHANGILSTVTIPDESLEKDRDLLRSREFVLRELSEVRTHIQSLLRRNGRNFKSETGAKSHWTKTHLSWIDRVINESSGSFKLNLTLLLQQLRWHEQTLEMYDEAVEQLAISPTYEKKVQALTAYRGIRNTFAMVMITEIGPVERFKHPSQLVSWMGLDIREYSSGGNQRRFGITRHGNRYLRTAFVEANQRSYQSSYAGKDVNDRRKKLPTHFVAIAQRCQARLYRKGNRLRMAGKHVNKIKVACAREMVGFVWESLRAVNQAS
jgi:transposase